MPIAPPRVCGTCGQPGCTGHKRAAWGHTVETPRIRGRKLQRMRDRLFDKQPLCVHCLQVGRTRVATIRDHVIPLAEGGRDDETNEQPLCQECSDIKTAAEALRGMRRKER